MTDIIDSVQFIGDNVFFDAFRARIFNIEADRIENIPHMSYCLDFVGTRLVEHQGSADFSERHLRGMREVILDIAARLVILPARDFSDLEMKTDALEKLRLFVGGQVHRDMMVKISLRADFARLAPNDMPEWLNEQ
jgi:hypothetical protein